MRTRAKSKGKTWPSWIAARQKVGGPALVGALKAYLARDPDVKRTGGPSFEQWLRTERWEHWLAVPGAVPVSPAAPVWAGPADLWAAVVARTDDKFARNYLAPSRWVDLPVRGLVPRNGYARDMLAREVGGVLKAFGVQLLAEDAA
jgi:hypothetical protein